jgi:hypothetical protein
MLAAYILVVAHVEVAEEVVDVREEFVVRDSSSDDVVLSVVARKSSQKPDCPSPVQVYKRQGSRGLLSRRSVHAEGRDEENEGGIGAMNWKEAVAYGFSYRLGFASAWRDFRNPHRGMRCERRRRSASWLSLFSFTY